ncbi:MAG: HD domain-containing protein [Persicimonas sp.]
MTHPVTIGAVDAGTNAVRVVIARATRPGKYTRLHKERWPARLGHQVFTQGRFGPHTLAQAVEAFQHFRDLFDRYQVDAYRTVATSATREAENRPTLVERIRREANIRLDVISGTEEARLTRIAVQHALDGQVAPELVVDIGGGSLELISLSDGRVVDSVSLPIGTVRLMETFGITGRIDAEEERMLRRYVTTLLDDYFEQSPAGRRVAVGCGGNVEALAELVGGPKRFGQLNLDFSRLDIRMDDILRLDVPQRMAAFDVRRDRAEVMGIAAVVLASVGEYMRIGGLLAPDVGVREGVLVELTSCALGADGSAGREQRRGGLVERAWRFARRFQAGDEHAECVRRLSLSIFDQLADHHRLGAEHRLALELGAILHDVGNAVSRQKHHKHGEYLVKNADIDGLGPELHGMVTALVRHHAKSFPAKRHSTYSSLDEAAQSAVRKLAGILRIADGLDAHYAQSVDSVDVSVEGATAVFGLNHSQPSELPALGAKQKGHLFEVAFELEPIFKDACA